MDKVYLIGGLGADERVFTSLMAGIPEAIFLPWLRPLPSESLIQYSIRLSENIDSPTPIIIAVSFGGMVAVEIARHLPGTRLILLSTAKSKNELPSYFRLAGRLRLHRIFPPFILKYTAHANSLLFGVSKVHRSLLQQIISDTDPTFIKWAIGAIVKWEGTTFPENYLHLHGSNDRILPIRFTNFAIPIPGAGHFMIVDRAEELIPIILRRLSQIQS